MIRYIVVQPNRPKSRKPPGWNGRRTKAYDLGLEVVEIGLHYVPHSDALLIQRGIIYAMAGKYEAAQNSFQLAGKTEVDKDSAFVGLGLTYIVQGDLGRGDCDPARTHSPGC